MQSPIKPRHHPSEPAHGLFRRIALAMGTDPGTHAREHGLDWAAIRRGHSTAAVAELAGVDPVALDGVTVRLGAERGQVREDWARFRGVSYRYGVWRSSKRRCVACDLDDIREYGETCGRWWYDFRLVDRCPKHGNALISHCPDCADWIVEGRPRCLCGVDLAAATAATTPDHGAWARYVVAHFDGAERLPVPALDALSTFEAIRLATIIGRMLRRRPGESLADAERGYLALRLGPEGLARHGKFFRTLGGADGRRWEDTHFARLTAWLGQTDEPGRVVVAQMARDFVASRTPEGTALTLYGQTVNGAVK